MNVVNLFLSPQEKVITLEEKKGTLPLLGTLVGSLSEEQGTEGGLEWRRLHFPLYVNWEYFFPRSLVFPLTHFPVSSVTLLLLPPSSSGHSFDLPFSSP